MGEGDGRSAGLAKEKGKQSPETSPAAIPGGEHPVGQPTPLDGQSAGGPTGNQPAEHWLKGVYSPSGNNQTGRPQFGRDLAMETLIPMLDFIQPGVGGDERFAYAVVHPNEEAQRQFRWLPNGPEKAELMNMYVQARNANMLHNDYPFGMDNPKRRGFAAYMIAKQNDPVCEELAKVVGNEYLPRVFARGGKLLEANSQDPAKQQEWQDEINDLAKIAALIEGHNYVWHDRLPDRNNENAEFRPYDEFVRPSRTSPQHLPEEFITNIFRDKDGNPIKFNPRDLQRQQMLTILQGDKGNNLTPEDHAVRELCLKVMRQELPLGLLDDNGLTPQMIASRNQYRDGILQAYAADFRPFAIACNKLRRQIG